MILRFPARSSDVSIGNKMIYKRHEKKEIERS